MYVYKYLYKVKIFLSSVSLLLIIEPLHRAGAESKTLGGQTYWEVEILGGQLGGAVLVGSQNIGGAAAPPAPPVLPALHIRIKL